MNSVHDERPGASFWAGLTCAIYNIENKPTPFVFQIFQELSHRTATPEICLSQWSVAKNFVNGGKKHCQNVSAQKHILRESATRRGARKESIGRRGPGGSPAGHSEHFSPPARAKAGRDACMSLPALDPHATKPTEQGPQPRAFAWNSFARKQGQRAHSK